MRSRLLLLTENFPPDRGGMSESCDRIVRGLRAGGAEVDVVRLDRRAADGAHTINCAWNRIRATRDLEAITHVVAFGGALPLLAAPAFAAWIGRPLVTLLRGNELDAGLFDPRRRAVLDDALRRSAAVCTVTTEQAEKVASLYDIEPVVISNGIDFDLWQATGADHARAAAWRAANVDPDRRLLGFFGHLKAKKGVPFFIDALQRAGLAERAHLLLVGDNAEVAVDDLTHSRVAPVDRFDLIPFYLACDFVVLPSHYDGFPNVLIEAASLARPILASNVGGMRDLLADPESGFLFQPGDEHACRAAIHRAFGATSETLASMGAAAERLVRRRCDARDEARRYLEVLSRLRRADAPETDRRVRAAEPRLVRR